MPRPTTFLGFFCWNPMNFGEKLSTSTGKFARTLWSINSSRYGEIPTYLKGFGIPGGETYHQQATLHSKEQTDTENGRVLKFKKKQQLKETQMFFAVNYNKHMFREHLFQNRVWNWTQIVSLGAPFCWGTFFSQKFGKFKGQLMLGHPCWMLDKESHIS